MSNVSLEPKQKPNLDRTCIMPIEKRSSSKMFWNKRALALKEGILSYYSCARVLQTSDLGKFQPKTSVSVDNILFVGPPEKAKKPNSLEITFMAKDALKKGAQSGSVNQSVNSSYGKELMSQQQPIVIRKKKEVIVWEVAFSKPDQLKEFVIQLFYAYQMATIEKIRHPEAKDPEEQHKQFEIPPPGQVQHQQQQPQINQHSNHDDQQEKHPDNHQRSSSQDLHQQEVIRQLEIEKQLKLEESLRQQEEKKKLEEELERQKQLQQEELQRRLEKENKLKQEKQLLIEQLEQQKLNNGDGYRKQLIKEKLKFAWNYHFIQSIEIAHLRDPQTIEETVTNSFVMHEAIAKMANHALQVVKVIIEELALPNQLKRIKPTISVSEQKFIRSERQSPELEEDFYVHEGLIIKLAFSQLQTIKVHLQNQPKSLQVYNDAPLKALGNEFRYLSILADSIESLLQEDETFPLRVPLCLIADFKGIRAFVLAVPPLSEIVLGPTANGQYFTNTAIQQQLFRLAGQLNLKPHKMHFENELISSAIPLSLFVEVHSIQKEDFIEFRWFENEQHLPDFPPQNLNLYMITKCADIMPLYIDTEKDIQPTRRLRPEYVRGLERPLNPDSFLSALQTPETQSDDKDVHDSSLRLRESIKKFLDSPELNLPITPMQFTQLVHKHGLNMRFLGQMCLEAKYQHIKELCIVEMVARVCKKVFRNNIADLMRNLKQQLMRRMRGGELELSMVQEISNEDLKDAQKMKQLQHRLCCESTMDFFNLVLGVGRESDVFWNQIVQKQVWYDYGFYFDASSRFSLDAKGLLFFALCFHCGVGYPMSLDTISGIFKAAFPIQERSQLQFEVRQKTFELSTSRISKRSRRNNDQQSLRWAIELAQLQGHPYQELLLDIEYESNQQMLEVCESLADNCTLSAIKPLLAAISLNEYEKALGCFEQALQILELHLGQCHPAYGTLYCIMGHYLTQKGCFEDALALFRSALACLQRVLGPDHKQIAEVYTDMGQLYQRMNESVASQQQYERALSILQKQGLYSSPQYGRCLLQLGYLYFGVQKLESAYEFTEAAIEIYQQFEYSFTEELIEALNLQLKIAQGLRNEQRHLALQQQLELLHMRHNQ